MGDIILHQNNKKGYTFIPKYIIIFVTILLTGGLLSACGNGQGNRSSKDHSSKVTAISKESDNSDSSHKQVESNSTSSNTQHHSAISQKLVTATDKGSAGPTSNYYWVNGKAHITGFSHLKAGDYRFTNDNQGRSATARAVLTYAEYQSSKGSRQGEPLAPPAWPSSNPKVAINYSLTGRTYHGYLYNRSHSIADSLLGSKSYTSEYNFTTGTRPQNVGADQSGGMRYAEEAAENYWNNHPGTKNTIDYETTPVYKGNENIPRGSIVNIKSSDNVLNTEIVVINSVEGIKINYNDGSSNAKPITSPNSRTKKNHSSHSNGDYHGNSARTSKRQTTNSQTTTGATSQATNKTTKEGQWTVAAAGMVFVSDSQKYYSRVTNPTNYQYVSETQATANGATRAARGNQYARP